MEIIIFSFFIKKVQINLPEKANLLPTPVHTAVSLKFIQIYFKYKIHIHSILKHKTPQTIIKFVEIHLVQIRGEKNRKIVMITFPSFRMILD